MAVDVVMPQMGESIFEGTITKWLKKPGDKVERDEPLFEISTDKVDAEIPSPSAGVLKEIKIAEGQTVPIQTIVAVIDGAGSAAIRICPCRGSCQGCPGSSSFSRTRRCQSCCPCTGGACFGPRRARRCGLFHFHRTHSFLAAGSPPRQGTWRGSFRHRRHRRRRPHHQGRH